jgi:hypothetical protein
VTYALRLVDGEHSRCGDLLKDGDTAVNRRVHAVLAYLRANGQTDLRWEELETERA